MPFPDNPLGIEIEDILSVEQFEEQFNQLWRTGKHGEALALAQDFAKKLDTVADFFSEAGDDEYAKEFYLQAQEIYRSLFRTHPNFASNLNSLAYIYYTTGEYEKAEQLYQEALEIWRSALGESHAYVAAALNNLGQLFKRTGQYEKAEPLLLEALTIRRETLQDVQDNVAESLNNLAMLRHTQSKYQEAEPLLLEALELRRVAVGEQHPAFAMILNNLGLLYEAKSDYQRALTVTRQASEIWHTTFGEKDLRFASSLNNLGVLYQTTGDYVQAEEKLQSALNLRRELLPATDPDIGNTLNNLAMLYKEIGKYTQAEQYYREALTIYEVLPGDDHFEIAQSMDGLATVLAARGDYEQAESYCVQALEMTRHALGHQHPDVARCLNSLAVLYETTSQYDRAQETLEQALAILQSFGPDDDLYVLTLDNLAGVQYARGNYAQAEIYYQQVLKQHRALLGEQHPHVAQSLNNLAVLHRLIGDNAKAEDFYLQALQITRTVLGDKHPDVAQILNNAALLYHDQSDFAHEEELLQRAYEIWNATLPADHPSIGTVLDSLGTVHYNKGDYQQAEQLFQQALTIRRTTLGNKHVKVALSLNNLAVLYESQGQWHDAEPLYLEALTILRQTLKDAHPDVAEILRNLAGLYAAMQHYTDALTIVQQAAAIDDQTIGQIFSIGSESQRLVYLTTLREAIEGFLSLIGQHLSDVPEAVQAGFDLVLRRKAMGAEALLVQRDAILRGRYPELKSSVDKLTLLRSQIAQMILEGSDTGETSAYQKLLETKHQEQEQLESALAHQIPEMNIALGFQRVDRHAIAMALLPGTFLIELVYLDTVNFHALPAQQQARWQPACYMAFILKARTPEAIQVINLGKASFINQKISEFRAAVMHKEAIHAFSGESAMDDNTSIVASDAARTFILARSQEEANTESTQCGYLLRRAIFDPLLPHLEGCQQLFLAPDGDLAWLPFEALPQDDGSYLIDHYQFTYLTTSRDVVRFASAPISQPTPSLVIADPDFDLHLASTADLVSPQPVEGATRHASDLDRSIMQFSRLAGAQLEGEQIARLLQTKPIMREEVLDAYFKRYRSPFILHIATHGFFLPDQLQKERIGTENEDNRLWRLSRRHIENPLLRSGLVLAGANTWGRGEPLPVEAEDGLLTAEDVASMDLTGTELVVLSACETGLGQVYIGEGIFGLRRAFALAGAKTLVMSLWKVDDQQTQVLMQDFYQRILEGQPRAEALRAAQLALKSRYPHPYYWGAFICEGMNGPLPTGAHHDYS